MRFRDKYFSFFEAVNSARLGLYPYKAAVMIGIRKLKLTAISAKARILGNPGLHQSDGYWTKS
jgi:hypothetical protein